MHNRCLCNNNEAMLNKFSLPSILPFFYMYKVILWFVFFFDIKKLLRRTGECFSKIQIPLSVKGRGLKLKAIIEKYLNFRELGNGKRDNWREILLTPTDGSWKTFSSPEKFQKKKDSTINFINSHHYCI